MTRGLVLIVEDTVDFIKKPFEIDCLIAAAKRFAAPNGLIA
jgi:FixJ family two-component response regulator